MFWNFYSLLGVVLAALGLVWLGPRFVAAFKRFDAENRARIEAERADRRDSAAHIRHTFSLAEEQVENIITITEPDPRTATPSLRYVFEGEHYATREEAEEARARKIGDIARGFYRELPAALAARKREGQLG